MTAIYSSEKYDACIYTDGGSSTTGHSGAASIVISGAKKHKFVAYLGQASDAESELFAAILGLSVLKLVCGDTGKRVLWRSDNQTAVKIASQYLQDWQARDWQTASKMSAKNIGMWKAYLFLTNGHVVTPEYVKAHAGDHYNESCDRACRWMIQRGKKMLDEVGPGLVGRNKTLNPESAWHLLDGRCLLDHLRNENSIDSSLQTFCKTISSL